jgi:hypothetical protein
MFHIRSSFAFGARAGLSLTAALSSLAFLGCGAPDGTDTGWGEDPAGASQELFGAFIVGDNCSAANIAKIEEGLTVLRSKVASEEFEKCVRNTPAIDHQWLNVEDVLRKIRAHFQIRISCADSSTVQCGGVTGWWGCAGPMNGGTEQLTLAYSLLDFQSAEQVAVSTAHELGHNYNYWHDHHIGASVPDLLEECVHKVDWSQIGRYRIDQLSDDVTLPHVGAGSGGNTYSRCWNDEYATGLAGAVNSADSTLFRLGLECRVGSSGSLASAASKVGNHSPPAGGTAFTRSCPAAHVLVGVRATQSSFVQTVEPVCAAYDAVRQGNSYGLDYGAPVGVYVADAVTEERICPRGKVVVGLNTGEGWFMDRVEVICDDAHSRSRRGHLALGIIGGNGGGPTPTRYCDGNTVMEGMYGYTAIGGGGERIMRHVGPKCVPVAGASAQLGTIQVMSDGRPYHWIGGAPWNVGNPGGDQEWASFCNPGHLMVGATGRAANPGFVGNAAAICAPWATWSQTGTPDPSYVAAGDPGSSYGSAFSLKCPRPTVVVGFDGRAGALVDQLSFQCGWPQSGVSVASTAGATGTSSGTPFPIQRCPDGGPLSGLRTESNTTLRRAGGVCGRAFGTRVVADNPAVLPFKGTPAPVESAMQDVCPDDYVLVGIKGRKNSTTVERIGGVCAPIADARAGTTTNEISLPQRGNPNASVGTAFTVHCPARTAALGYEGRYSGVAINDVKLACGTLDLAPGLSLTGTLSSNTDRKIYRVYEPPGRTSQTISVSGLSGSNQLTLQRFVAPTNTAFDVQSATNSLSVPAPDGFVVDDFYYVMVKTSSTSGGSFTLSVSP